MTKMTNQQLKQLEESINKGTESFGAINDALILIKGYIDHRTPNFSDSSVKVRLELEAISEVPFDGKQVVGRFDVDTNRIDDVTEKYLMSLIERGTVKVGGAK